MLESLVIFDIYSATFFDLNFLVLFEISPINKSRLSCTMIFLIHFRTITVLKHFATAYTIMKIKHLNPILNKLLMSPVVDAFIINCNTKATPTSKQDEINVAKIEIINIPLLKTKYFFTAQYSLLYQIINKR